MIDEIPTLAIEDVFIFNNTSIIQDEVLSHRLGLIPLKGDKESIRSLSWLAKPSDENPDGGQRNDYNTILLRLKVECDWQDKGKDRLKKGETDPKKLYTNSSGRLNQRVPALSAG
jgi:DNA-directed RNA polymerases I and III subunit RPAC1